MAHWPCVFAASAQAQTVAGGASHTVILKSDGTVWAVGNNTYGQLGDGTNTPRLTAVQVTGLSDIIAVTAGANHSLAITSTGTLYAWGYTNIDKAAVEVLREYNPASIRFDSEYGGSFCRGSDGAIFATRPFVNIVFSDSVLPSLCPSGIERLGRYRTHGRSGGATFSSTDINNANADPGKAWFLATPCGDIDKYVGPNFTQYYRLAEKTETPVRCTP